MSQEFTSDKQKPKTIPRTVLVGVAQIRIETLQEFGLNIIEAAYDNQDSTNPATLRKVPSGVLITVPANAIGVIENEIFSFIEVNPDAVTGSGVLTLTLATTKELKSKGFL